MTASLLIPSWSNKEAEYLELSLLIPKWSKSQNELSPKYVLKYHGEVVKSIPRPVYKVKYPTFELPSPFTLWVLLMGLPPDVSLNLNI